MYAAHSTRRTLARTLLALSLAAPAGAQTQYDYPRPTTAFAALSVNALVGGATAAVRARIGKRDPVRAFARGSLGGAVHFAGKYVAARPGSVSGPVGVVIGSTGTAMVANAGRGASAFDELFLPAGPVRVRLARGDSGARRRVRLSVNVYESVMLARAFARRGLEIDWERSAAAGAFVFVAPGRELETSDGDPIAGLAAGSVVVVSGVYRPLAPIVRHEAAHAQQQWFTQEVWGRPAEEWARRRVPGLRRLPAWIEPGVAMGLLDLLEYEAFGRYGPLGRLGESEAELLERE